MTQKLYFLDTHIAGRQYYQADDVWPYLYIGVNLTLRAEPSNPSDPFAVSVWLPKPEAKLGYLPRSCNQTISQFLQMGWTAPFLATLSRLDPAAPFDSQLHLTISILPAPVPDTPSSPSTPDSSPSPESSSAPVPDTPSSPSTPDPSPESPSTPDPAPESPSTTDLAPESSSTHTHS